MSDKRIYLSPPHMGDHEQLYVKDAFDTNWISPFGKNTEVFEMQLKQHAQVEHAIALSSGTAALHLAMLAIGIKKGDIVICQDLTFAATAFPINYVGAEPIFIDSENLSWNMDPDLLEEVLNNLGEQGKKAAAIVVVHLYGMPADMKRIMEISRKYGVPVIEDAAEAMGSTYQGLPCGGIGDIGIFSFNGNKIITTSGGGAVLTNSDYYASRVRHLSSQAREATLHYEHKEIGYNYRMSNVLAGIGRGQMEVLEQRVTSRRSNFDFYKAQFKACDGFILPDEPDGCFSNRWLTAMLVDANKTGGVGARDIIQKLQENNIESRPVWMPMHMQPAMSSTKSKLSGVGSTLFETGICLPSGSSLTQNELETIAEIVIGMIK